jgi:hypothetical protein
VSIEEEKLEDYLCRCERKQGLGTEVTLALEGGGHTKCFVWKCQECHGLVAFPRDNFMIFLKKGTLDNKVWFLQKVIKADGYARQRETPQKPKF